MNRLFIVLVIVILVLFTAIISRYFSLSSINNDCRGSVSTVTVTMVRIDVGNSTAIVLHQNLTEFVVISPRGIYVKTFVSLKQGVMEVVLKSLDNSQQSLVNVEVYISITDLNGSTMLLRPIQVSMDSNAIVYRAPATLGLYSIVLYNSGLYEGRFSLSIVFRD